VLPPPLPAVPVSLKVRHTPARGPWVEGLSEHYVTSEVVDLLIE
jgi:hypothetical protein